MLHLHDFYHVQVQSHLLVGRLDSQDSIDADLSEHFGNLKNNLALVQKFNSDLHVQKSDYEKFVTMYF